MGNQTACEEPPFRRVGVRDPQWCHARPPCEGDIHGLFGKKRGGTVDFQEIRSIIRGGGTAVLLQLGGSSGRLEVSAVSADMNKDFRSGDGKSVEAPCECEPTALVPVSSTKTRQRPDFGASHPCKLDPEPTDMAPMQQVTGDNPEVVVDDVLDIELVGSQTLSRASTWSLASDEPGAPTEKPMTTRLVGASLANPDGGAEFGGFEEVGTLGV